MINQRLAHNSITYFFVMDGAKFETPGLLLAESLRGVLGDGPDIVAYTPHSKIASIRPVTRRMMDLLRVDIRGFDDQQANWSPSYPHGNKILAAAERRDTDLSVFLDTDVVCLGAPDFSVVTPTTPLFATPEGVPTWGRDDADWTPVYDMFGLEMPDWRVKLVKGRRRVVLPYFNAGVVGFVERGNPSGQRLPDLWLETAIAIDANPVINNKRPWLDQIALPVAAARMGGRVEVLSDLHNYSPYRLKDGAELSNVKLFHYRMPAHYRKYAACRQITEQLLARAPARMRSKVRRRLGMFVRDIQLPEELIG